MAKVLIVGASGRLVPAKDGKGPSRYFGKLQVVRGRAISEEGARGVQVASLNVDDQRIIEAIIPNVPGYFDLDSGVEQAFGEFREKVYGLDYLGDERLYGLTPLGIFARKVADKANGQGAVAGAAPARV